MRISIPVFRLFQVLIVGLLLCGPVFAAEEVVQTPEETPVITPEPTVEVTQEPTISSTPEITPTITPAPTPETTPESTPVVTAPPTAEPTAVATETPAAEPTPVVTDTVAPEPTPAATEVPTAEPTPDSGITTPATSVETPAPVKALSTTAPVAALSANKTSWSAPAAIRFYDRSTGSPTSRIWDFGDGTNSTLKNPEHVYTAPGAYTVTLTVINDLGSDTTTSTDYIHVYDPVVPVAALSANKTAWSAPAAIRFYDRSTGFPTSWNWDFGDGTTSTVKNPEHVYSSAGTYTVSLIVTNPQGSDTKVATDYITVSDSSVPVAALSANRTAWSAPAPIRFYDRSTGFPTSWNWDFGDGTTSTVKNPEHVYSSAGTYTVTLTVTNPQGSDAKVATDYITVSDPVAPVAALSANKTAWSAPAPIRFYDRSTGFPTTWSWDFGDGTTSTVKNPEHVYASAGTYTVSLIVTNPQGTDTKIATDYITVSDSSVPVAALSANKTAWSAPAPIRFYDRSTGFPTSWSWDFGDGTTSTVKNPEHVYASAGMYTVSLIVTNPQGTDTKIATDYITVSDSSVPVAALSANKTAWSAPAPIRFYDRSTGFPTSWSWDFGDGMTSTVKNPEHVYAATGTYTVTLTVTNPQGSDTKVATDYITISDASVPVAALSANKTAWSAPAPIRFYDRSTGFPTTWAWDFGDGTTSDVKNPEHVYLSTGNYSVTLTVTNPLGTDTITSTDYVHIYDALAPVARLSANKTAWSAPAAIRFYDRSTGFPTTWVWDFGDGTTSDVKNPEHVYAATGNYSVTLTVTNPLGTDTKIATDYIRVSDAAAPVAALSANRTTGVSPAAIRFYDRSTGFPTSWNWDFGDGATSTVKNPEHTFTAPGNYTINLTVTNTLGSSAIARTDYLRITPVAVPLDANFTADTTTGMAPLAVNFTDLSTGFPASWNWSFGDGNFSAEQHPAYTYVSPGNFTVNLTVDDGYGGNDMLSMPEYVRVTAPFVISNFTANATAGQAPFAVAFTDLSEGFPTMWNWSFGDGMFSEEQHPTHSYVLASNYTVSLVASNAFASDNRTVEEYVMVEPATPAFDAEIILNSMPTTMFQGEHYIVDIKVNNTGTETWSGDIASSNLVFLQGLGDAAAFNITHIPMMFQNETVAPGESYDFFFFVEAPDTIGDYTPEYKVSSSAAGGAFGRVATANVSVIENPFHPVKQPDGSKLYSTTLGNLSTGTSVTVYGPKVYAQNTNIYQFQDPRYLINPTLKSGVFDLDLNESFTYADVTIKYDPGKTSNPSRLSISYYNKTNGNYTVVPSVVDTINHTVTSRVTHFSKYGILDPVEYFNLPFNAQNEMGYFDVYGADNWTIFPVVDSFSTYYFNGGQNMPPGNYTIYTSGSYSNINLMGMGCYAGWSTADSNPDSWSGMYIVYHDPSGISETQVQNRRYTSGVLKITHAGGPIGIYNRHTVSGSCGSVSYKMVYTDGPLFGDPNTDYYRKLINDLNNLADPLNLIERYRAGVGCILGQAGKKGNFVEQNLGSVPGYGLFLGEDKTESAAYFIGHVACSIPFIEITSVRDVAASLYTGDDLGALLNSLGLLGPFKTALTGTGAFTSFLEKNAGKTDLAKDFFTQLDRMGLADCWTDAEKYIFMQKTLSPEEMTVLNRLLGNGDISYERAVQYIISNKGLVKGWVWAETGWFNVLPGIKNHYSPVVGKTVIGSGTYGTPYYKVGDVIKVHDINYLYFETTPTWDMNKKFLDLAIYNGDEIILSTHPTEFPTEAYYLASNLYPEIEYLKSIGYKISDTRYADGFYRIVRA